MFIAELAEKNWIRQTTEACPSIQSASVLAILIELQFSVLPMSSFFTKKCNASFLKGGLIPVPQPKPIRTKAHSSTV